MVGNLYFQFPEWHKLLLQDEIDIKNNLKLYHINYDFDGFGSITKSKEMKENEIKENGIKENGIKENGIKENEIKENEIKENGIKENEMK